MVLVSWIDAAFELDYNTDTMDEWLSHGGMRGQTLGWLVAENDKCVVVANERFMDGSKRGFTVIPRGMVTKITKVVKNEDN